MGNGGSRNKNSPFLTPDQRDSIRTMLDVTRSDRNLLTADIILNVWRDKLSDGLLDTFLDYLFRSSKVIPIEEFELFFYNMVEASIEIRAKMIVALLGIDDTIPPRNMQTYVSDLLQSYVKILRQKVPRAYSSWRTGDLTQKYDVDIISQFFIKDINFRDGKLPLEELKRWLRGNGFVKDLSETVVKIAFGIDIDELRPMLPQADNNSSLLRIPLVLALSHFTRDASKEWRLLYSSSEDPRSWKALQNKLFGQGPTLVLIQDKAGPLLGGFASQSWKISPHFYGDENSFLFRLRPELRICAPSGNNGNFQYLNSRATTLPNGLGMGGQLNYFGFFLSSEFGSGSVSKTCTTFKDYIPLASNNEFVFSRLEIWAINAPDFSEDGARKDHSFVKLENSATRYKVSFPDPSKSSPSNVDPAAAALLEMAGLSGFSKGVKQ